LTPTDQHIQHHREPHHAATPRRRDDSSPHPWVCPHRGHPAMTSANVHPPPSQSTGAARSSSSLSRSCAERRRRQGPPAATRSGYARALTPTPHSARPEPSEEAENRSKHPLTGPAPSGMTHRDFRRRSAGSGQSVSGSGRARPAATERPGRTPDAAENARRNSSSNPLTQDRVSRWHLALKTHSLQGMRRISACADTHRPIP
jgi:hypothetical protein